ncbi:secretogranin-2a [Salminus brasiliensis]|uniref:secretogranin-2a n=1 Tax=Salminus brasiliensis TaxID=930266 RepID=UPI003B8372FB
MSSLPQLCTTGLSLLASLSLLCLFLSLNIGVHGATLRESRLWGNEPNAFRPGSQAPPPPSAAMLQALQYIQSLSRRTLHDPVANIEKPAVPDDDLEDLESMRAMLQLASPARTSSATRDSRAEEEEEKEDDKAQQWLQAVLSTLQQTEDQISPLKTPHREPTHSLSPTRPRFMLSPAEAKQQQDELTDDDYERSLSSDNQGVRRNHRKFPLMFEDKDGQDQPLKRTNENAEEQYTPQKLATLQSVFEELSRMPDSKADSKQKTTVNGEDNDGYREKKMVFDNLAGDEEELVPLEERTEQVEEETRKHEFNGGFREDRKEQEEKERNAEEEDKRSNHSDSAEMDKVEDPDDISRLVDYYLIKVLEKTEQEEHKRDQEKENEEEGEEEEEEEDRDRDREEERREEEEEEEEEDEEREKRRAAQPQYTVDPQSLYQLIQISKKLQIPPADILDLLESEGTKKHGKSWQRTPTQSQTPSLSYPSSYSTQRSPATALYQRPHQTPETSSVTQDILRILGLVSAAKPNEKSGWRPNQYKPSPALNYYTAERELPDYAFSDTSRDQREADYDDAIGEDELASLLAAEMLAQRQRRATSGLRDYFDQAFQSTPENRQPEQEEAGENSDEETLLKILNYLNPESEDTDETDINGKTVPGM